jgi:Uma2 family endonuclease
MSDPAPRLATYEDLLNLPEDVCAEVLGGAVVTSPAPLPKHSKAQGALRRFLGGPFDDDDGYGGPGGWWLFVEVDVALGRHDIVRPDLAGWRRERLPNPAEERPIEVVPDWVCEVLSPSTAARDKVQKRNLYARHGVRYHWVVDVDARTLEAFELERGRWVLLGTYGEEERAAIAPFEAVELDIGRLFLPKTTGER